MVFPVATPETKAAEGCDSTRVIYARREYVFAEVPSYAWIEVQGSDHVTAYFNGQIVGASTHGGVAPGAVVVDVTPMLRQGTNVLAVIVKQEVHSRRPQWSGRLRWFSGSQIDEANVANADETSCWKIAPNMQRQDDWWHSIDFDDSSWVHPESMQIDAEDSPMSFDPNSVRTPTDAYWLGTNGWESTGAWVTDFELPDKPVSSWLRVATNGAYRIAINGHCIVVDNEGLATARNYSTRFVTYDIGQFLTSGSNRMAVFVESDQSGPAAMTVCAGVTCWTAANKASSTSRANVHGDLRSVVLVNSESSWKCPTTSERWLDFPERTWLDAPRVVASAATNSKLSKAPRFFGSTQIPTDLTVRSSTCRVILFLATFFICVLASEIVRFVLKKVAVDESPWNSVYVAWLLPTVLFCWWLLASFDASIFLSQFVTQQALNGALLAILFFWLLLALIAILGRSRLVNWTLQRSILNSLMGQMDRRRWVAGCLWGWLVVATLVGFGLRANQIDQEPLHHDEVISFMYAKGILERGFPSTEIHPELPMDRCETSELLHYFIAPFMLLTDDIRLSIRIQAVLFGTATIPLIFFVGRRWFDPYSASIAMTLFAVVPTCVAMGCFGRYFSALAFFSLLVTDFFHRTISATCRVHRGWLLATTVMFLVMYMTWQASALLAFGLVAAMFVVRGRSVIRIVFDPLVWCCVVFVGSSVMLHLASRMNAQTVFITIGKGISNMELTAMWRFPFFKPFFFVSESCWIADTLLPLAGLSLALVICLMNRGRGVAEPEFVSNLRFGLTVPVFTCVAMGLVLPIMAPRYSYHFLVMVLLVNTAAICWLLRRLFDWSVGYDTAAMTKHLCRGVAVVIVVVWMVSASGRAMDLNEMRYWHNEMYRRDQLLFADWQPPIDRLRQEIQPGDVVITDLPHIVDLLMNSSGARSEDGGRWRSDAWLQSVVILLATMADDDPTVRSRMSGNIVLHDREAVEQFFCEHQRVWYLGGYFYHNPANEPEVKGFVRETMDVVYEDSRTVLMLHDQNHRSAMQREQFKADGDISLPWITN